MRISTRAAHQIREGIREAQQERRHERVGRRIASGARRKDLSLSDRAYVHEITKHVNPPLPPSNPSGVRRVIRKLEGSES